MISIAKLQQHFETATKEHIGKWLTEHTTVNTVVIFVNHLFRALSMLAFVNYLPYAVLTNCLIALAGSLFYRITIERLCAVRFALPACLGGIAMHYSLPYLAELVHNTSRAIFNAATVFGAVPAFLYFASVIILSQNSALQLKSANAPCCGK